MVHNKNIHKQLRKYQKESDKTKLTFKSAGWHEVWCSTKMDFSQRMSNKRRCNRLNGKRM